MVDSIEAAAETILTVLEHARKTKSDYEFGPINAEVVMRVGLYLDGDIDEVLEEVLEVPGAIISS
jgi:hypothetical protein